MHALAPALLLALVAGCLGAEWSYFGSHGPTNWGDNYATCDGKKQSPINIVPESTTYTNFDAFDFTSYETAVSNHTISNNGHTVQLSVIGGDLTIRGGGLPADYKAIQFHFHWGADSTQGSEHTIKSSSYPMEMHIVHYRTNETSIAVAASKPEGLAVLGFFFEVNTEGNTNPLMTSVINNLRKIRNKNENVKVPVYPFRPMLPTQVNTFYRYQGSLTTPPCSESVIWTVFTNTISVSESQLAEFRSELSGKAAPHDKILDNFRPVQSLNTRTVYRSFETLPTGDPSASQTIQPLFLLSLLLPVFSTVRALLV